MREAERGKDTTASIRRGNQHGDDDDDNNGDRTTTTMGMELYHDPEFPTLPKSNDGVHQTSSSPSERGGGKVMVVKCRCSPPQPALLCYTTTNTLPKVSKNTNHSNDNDNRNNNNNRKRSSIKVPNQPLYRCETSTAKHIVNSSNGPFCHSSYIGIDLGFTIDILSPPPPPPLSPPYPWKGI